MSVQPTSRPDPAPPEAVDDHSSRRRDRAVRTGRGVVHLFAARPELRGVYRLADHLEDAITWSA